MPATQQGADYRLRIFTPRSELPFAGHPTLGSAHAAIEAGRVTPQDGKLVQQCGQGLVPIAVEGAGSARRLVLDLPTPVLRPLDAATVDELEAIIGHKVLRDPVPAIVDVGAVWVVAQLESAEALLNLQPDFAHSAQWEARLGVTGLSLFGHYPQFAGAEIEVRSFAPSCGVEEDPVCGSGNGSIAAFRLARGQLPSGTARYVAAQGRMVGRDGFIDITAQSDARPDAGRPFAGAGPVAGRLGQYHQGVEHHRQLYVPQEQAAPVGFG